MIITRSPSRISLFGGSTDYESYYSQFGSTIIGFSINKYCYVNVKKLPDYCRHQYECFYSKVEKVEHLDEIENNGIRGTLSYLQTQLPLDKLAIYISNDFPASSGMASSTCLITSLINAIYTLYGKSLSCEELYGKAIYVERQLLNEAGGIQDTLWAVYGGFNTFHIEKNGKIKLNLMQMFGGFLQEFWDSSLLLYTGNQRNSYEVAKSHESNIQAKHDIKAIADEAILEFNNKNIENIGALLNKSWEAKKRISPLISNDIINNYYDIIMKNGGYGAKLLGSGQGGFIYVMCPKNKKHIIASKVNLPIIDWNFNFVGSQVIFRDKND